MANSLSAELLAAQENTVRFPLVEIKAAQFKNDLPFTGQRATPNDVDENDIYTITHSSGRIIGVYTEKAYNNYVNLKGFYTDVNRTQYTYFSLITNASSYPLSDLSLIELDDGRLALAYIRTNGGTYELRLATFNYDGTNFVSNVIKTSSNVLYSPSIIIANTGYLMSYIEDQPINATSGGTYTGTSNGTFYIEILSDGDQTTATYKWQKNQGAWSNPITMISNAQTLQDGVTITFAGSFWAGQTMQFLAVAALPARGDITAMAKPNSGDTVTIGSVVYTFRAQLTIPAVANEILIDSLSKDISLENLRCAIMSDVFEGTGVGVRFSTGTLIHPTITAIRDNNDLILYAKQTGTSGNSLTLTTDGTRLTDANFAGGSNSSIGAVIGIPSSKLYLTKSTTITGTWSTSIEPSIGGISGGRKKYDTFLARLSSNAIWLAFTYLTAGADAQTAVYNLFYAISVDDGTTWGNAISLTGFTTSNAISRRPFIMERLMNDVIIAYEETATVIHKRAYNASYAADPAWVVTDANSYITHCHFDPVHRKAYVTLFHQSSNIDVDGIIRIDVDSWAVDRYWTYNTVPAIPSILNTNNARVITGDKDQLMFWRVDSLDKGVFIILDDATNTFKTFTQETTYGVTKNIEGMEQYYQYGGEPVYNLAMNPVLNADEGRIYMAIAPNHQNDGTEVYFVMGYIEYKTAGPMYEFTKMINYKTSSPHPADCWYPYEASFTVDQNNGLIVFYYHTILTGDYGGIFVFTITDGALYRKYDYTEYEMFPKGGSYGVIVENEDKIWVMPAGWDKGGSQEALYGLLSIQLSSNTLQWHILPCGPDDPRLVDFSTYEGLAGFSLRFIGDYLVGLSMWFGVFLYDTKKLTWTFLDNTTIPNLNPTSGSYAGSMDYDELNQCLIIGFYSRVVAYVPLFGTLSRIYYRQYDGNSWNDASLLVNGLLDSSISINVEPTTNSLYGYWVRYNTDDGYRICWDKEIGNFDLAQYLTRGSAISLKRKIDGTPSSLSFTVSHGYLFDPLNITSLLSKYIRKGKKITLRWGESINETNYWQDGSSIFVVKSVRLNYKRGDYPIMEIECEDIRALWENCNIVASPAYSEATPESIYNDLLQKYANLLLSQIDIQPGAIDNSSPIYYQFIEESLSDAMKKLSNRFGYFVDVRLSDGKITLRKIASNNAIDHIYQDRAKFIEFSPDDSFSSFTNRVTVQGEGRYDLEVLMAEEQVGQQNGTVGFFTPKQTHRVYYSEDHNRRVKFVILDVTQKVSSIGYALAGGISLGISAIDPDDKWIEVTVKGKNLWPEFAVGLALIIAGQNTGTVLTSAGIRMVAAGTMICLQVLAAVGNYSFNIKGQPCGTVRQTFQASADDLILQNEIGGNIIEEKITDPFCYDVDQCRNVAEYELWVVQAQRNRVKFSKVCHLQDDVADTLQIPHPYANFNMKIFITDLERIMTIPENPDGQGEFIDRLEGWVL